MRTRQRADTGAGGAVMSIAGPGVCDEEEEEEEEDEDAFGDDGSGLGEMHGDALLATAAPSRLLFWPLSCVCIALRTAGLCYATVLTRVLRLDSGWPGASADAAACRHRGRRCSHVHRGPRCLISIRPCLCALMDGLTGKGLTDTIGK